MKASAFTLVRLTRDLITIARTTRATAITVTPTNIGGAAGIIATTTIAITIGVTTTIGIDELGLVCGAVKFLRDLCDQRQQTPRMIAGNSTVS